MNIKSNTIIPRLLNIRKPWMIGSRAKLYNIIKEVVPPNELDIYAKYYCYHVPRVTQYLLIPICQQNKRKKLCIAN